MPVKVITDSTCDLPADLIDRYGIAVVPLYINLGDQSFLDGVELSRQEFYQRLPDYSPPPQTAAPGPEHFSQAYQAAITGGATEILSIHLTASLSATVNSAQRAAQEITAAPVTVLDSQQISLGAGLLVLSAARAAAAGQTIAEMLPRLQQQIERTHLFAALDTLEYLRRSGRVNALVAGLGSMLQIKPLVIVHRGQTSSERVRTRRRAAERLISLLAEQAPLEQAALIHTYAPAEAQQLAEQAQPYLPAGSLLSVEVTPVIGAHVGPNAVGFVCVSARH